MAELLHDIFFEELVRKEYASLAEEGHTYLDFTGGGLSSSNQISRHLSLLQKHVLGNPHSTNPTSVLASSLVQEARQKVLDFFKADDYFCVFTANATGALKIVGESYPFGELLLLADNHNSVNGLREYAKDSFQYIPISSNDLTIDAEELTKHLAKNKMVENRLFAFPAQSNVSGVKHDLRWVQVAKANGWDVLLDAAAYVPTNPLDLSKIQADFVSISFYKIFGYPTGLGCLLVHKKAFEKLRKPWFAGGTVTLAAVKSCHYYLAHGNERFEDGTLAYSQLPALTFGIEHMEKIGMQRLTERIGSLASYLFSQMNVLKHSNGKPLVRIFGPQDRKNCGGNMIFVLLDTEGKRFSVEEIEESANREKISLRTGCFCNPGIDEVNNELSTEELDSYFSTRESGNYHDMIHELQKMRGSVRVSVGIATTKKDLDLFLRMISSYLNRKKE